MIIANPMYDTIFKHLMEDLNIAKGFLSQILRREIYELSFFDREQSRYVPKHDTTKDRVRLFRLDFIAEIDSDDGRRKVLIELQKSSEYDLVHRFRAYIGKAYAQEKEKHEQELKEEHRRAEEERRKARRVEPPEILPILPVLILGFELDPDGPSDADRMICHVRRQTINPNAGDEVLDVRYQLAECLSHDLILIQVPYIPEEPKTDLELMLSIFEQRFFVGDTWKKDYRHQLAPGHPLEPLLRDILQKLNVITEDAKVAQQIQDEEQAELYYQNLVASLEELEEQKQTIHAQKQALQEKDQALQEKDQALERALTQLMAQGVPEAQARSMLGLPD